MPTFTTGDGTTLYYKDWGTGKPVVFSHGWPLNADMWEYQMHALASAGYRCIAHDRRGFGRSEQPWSGYDYNTFADDLAALITHLDLRDVTLVGFSMGGGEVARYLSRHGHDRIARAVLLGAVTPLMLATHDNLDGVSQSVFDGLRAGISHDRPQFFVEFGPAFMGANRPGAAVSPGMLAWTLNMALMASLKGTLDCVGAFSETDFRPDMAAFTLPTLIIHGNDDQIVPIDTTAREAARMIPGARLEIYEGAPHGLYVTHKEQLNHDLLGFLAET